MRTILQTANSTELLIIFAGWGMDETVFGHLSAGNQDVLYCFDYTEPGELAWPDLTAKYRRISLLAWSFGVFAAGCCCAGRSFERALAVNGTLIPVDDRFGITEAVFQATLGNWSETVRHKFFRRMNDDQMTNRFFSAHPPRRTLESQRLELESLAAQAAGRRPPANCFDTVLIGRRDRIFPPRAQHCAWDREPAVRQIEADLPHYPFAVFDNYREIFHFDGN